jgi:redox-sensitive bicupin YhaK (pirin superfamily)
MEDAMFEIRRAHERGHANHGWLDSHHTFSFADYYDPRHMGFRSLRVINEDRVAPGGGFPRHPHRDMEILSYVLEGGLEHKDSMGNGSVIGPGELQRMSAGTGVTHSEKNASEHEPVHFLQIWLLPERAGLPPSYEQKSFPKEGQQGKLQVIASRDGRDGSVVVHQDVVLSAGRFDAGERVTSPLDVKRAAFVHVVRGRAKVMGETLGAGDAISISGEHGIEIEGIEGSELLLFDLA